MEHFIRIVFWTVALSSCLLAKPLTFDSNIHLMKVELKCAPGLTLYTPSNVEKQCWVAALECFKTELSGMLGEECEDPAGRISEEVEFLQLEIKQLLGKHNSNGQNHTTECACEKWPETNFKEFLNAEENLVQLTTSA
ncbi:uncharacterized protein V6R79_010565 [Siganus canaliculatus]